MTNKKIEDGGPAFPCDEVEYSDTGEVSVVAHRIGLSKREYFAGLAMQGILMSEGPDVLRQGSRCNVGEASLRAADAILAELGRKEGEG